MSNSPFDQWFLVIGVMTLVFGQKWESPTYLLLLQLAFAFCELTLHQLAPSPRKMKLHITKGDGLYHTEQIIWMTIGPLQWIFCLVQQRVCTRFMIGFALFWWWVIVPIRPRRKTPNFRDIVWLEILFLINNKYQCNISNNIFEMNSLGSSLLF